MGKVLEWWMILYYPVLFLLLYVGNRSDRLRGKSERRDKALGCIFMCLVVGPLAINIAQIIFHAVR